MVSKLLTPFKMGVGGQLADGKQEEIMSWISREDWVKAEFITLSSSNVTVQQQAQLNNTGNTLNTAVIRQPWSIATALTLMTNHTFTRRLALGCIVRRFPYQNFIKIDVW